MLLLRETVLHLLVLLREETVKQLSELPFRAQLPLGILYLIALGLIMTANTIAILKDCTPGYTAGLILQFYLLFHLIRRA